jgi:DUF971 family protein
MSGLTTDQAIPTEIRLHQKSRQLEIAFDDGSRFTLPYEYLRVMTPSAEARGHGPGQETLQTGKREITIASLDPIGNYAIRPVFSDGHDSGLYSWDLLYNLGKHQDELWATYLELLETQGGSRDASPDAAPAAGGGCSSGGCSSGGCSK